MGDPDVDGGYIKMDHQEVNVGTWTGSSGHRIGRGGGHL
jgi:hypothetical protein